MSNFHEIVLLAVELTTHFCHSSSVSSAAIPSPPSSAAPTPAVANPAINASQAEREAEELANAFTHALSHQDVSENDNSMNVDNEEEDGDEGDERDQEDEEGIPEDPQARLAKEWVCIASSFFGFCCSRLMTF